MTGHNKLPWPDDLVENVTIISTRKELVPLRQAKKKKKKKLDKG